ncbi:hypothetical protein EC957_010893 [Mortierella hygrophila]|uniref:Uncharacterized protein n=1 Tax=Mortierella hygrophila TaxID=979708 RepID=A0A9P6K449_9FUNG|nr:hypothetical protein EC957_010893 [Mortierella hygrophila]
MKRPSLPKRSYSVTSHSSRSVQLTEEITPREMALSIVQAQYHIYHTDLSGYTAGADLVQDALTRFALGGTSRDLYQTFKRFRPDKERIPPTPTITITTRNWRDWLGHKSYYHDYLDFFDQLLEQEQDASETEAEAPILSPSSSTSAFTSDTMGRMAKLVAEYLTPLIPGLCASTGALIHLGYGVEFRSRLAMAEGLAYACISYQPATTCFIPSNVPSSWQHKTTTTATSGVTGATGATGTTVGGVTKRSPTVSILNMVRNDKRLDGMFDAGFQGRLNVVMSSRVSLLKSYLGMWTSQVRSVEEALKDLSQTSSLLLFTATNRFGDQQQLDKHLANVLLATHAARFLIHVLPGEVEKEQLLKAIWMSLVATFVVQGRPKLSLSQSHQQHQQPMMAEVNPQDAGEHDGEEIEAKSMNGEMKVPSGRWKILAQDAIHADHQIVSKIVRCLWWAEMEHGSCGGLFYDAAFRAIGDDPASDESTGPGF